MNKTLEKYNNLLKEGMNNFNIKKALKEIKKIDSESLEIHEDILKHTLINCLIYINRLFFIEENK